MRAVVLAVLALLTPTQQAPADEAPAPPPAATREEQWRREREAKAEHLEAYRPGFVERNLLAIEKAERPSILMVNVGGFYPRVEAVSRGSKTAMGLRFWQPSIKDSGISVHGSAFRSVIGYELYALEVGVIPNNEKRLPPASTETDDAYALGDAWRSKQGGPIFYSSFRYRHLPREDFFGLGPGARRQDHSSFLLQDASYGLVAGYQFGRRFAVTVRGRYLQFFAAEGEDAHYPNTQALFTDATAPGLSRQPDFVQVTSRFLLDFRDTPGNPHRGVLLAGSHDHVDDRGGNAFRFDRVSVDARAFAPLGSVQRVVAVRAVGTVDVPTSGSRVPFYLQQTLGGSHTLRGFDSFRFRGEKLLLLQAEYRWEASPAVELALFTDAGAVGRRGEDLGGFETDYGFGLRFKVMSGTLLRLDVARSREATRFFARFGGVF